MSNNYIKPPVWIREIPLHFFLGGLAGMAAVIAAVAEVGGQETRLVRAGLALAVGAAILSLRVFEWRSAMSVRAWIPTLFGACATAALALHLWIYAAAPVGTPGLAADLAYWTALGLAALLGLPLASHTGVLIGATAIPARLAHHRGLPILFGAAALGAAICALELLGFRLPAFHALGIGVSAVVTAFGAGIELHRHGPVDRALRHGAPGALLRGSWLLAGPIALALRLLGLVPAADVSFLVGAVMLPCGWVAAGRASALDPEAPLAAQRSGAR